MNQQIPQDDFTDPHGRHFKHCYAYEGSFCSCGGQYAGDEPGPRMELPGTPFNLSAPQKH